MTNKIYAFVYVCNGTACGEPYDTATFAEDGKTATSGHVAGDCTGNYYWIDANDNDTLQVEYGGEYTCPPIALGDYPSTEGCTFDNYMTITVIPGKVTPEPSGGGGGNGWFDCTACNNPPPDCSGGSYSFCGC